MTYLLFRRASVALAFALAAFASPFVSAASQAPDDFDRRVESLPAKVDAIAKRWIDERGAAGMSIVVLHDGKPLVSKAYGLAHVELEVPTPDRALYETGSEAKTFTGAAIMKLVERGQLKLDDPLAKHLPDIIPDAGRITLRQLLTHTSGVFEYTAIPEYEALSTTTQPREELVKLIAAAPLAFEPGTAQSYSNSGYLLLGLVVEKVSGKPWGRFIEQEIFPLAGMDDSRASWNRQVDPRMTTGYEFDETGKRMRAPHHEPEWTHGNGGLRSSAPDMAKWLAALHGGRVLGEAAYREFIAPAKLADGTALRYGLGLAVDQPMLGHRVLRHGGTYPGYTSYSAYLPDEELIVVTLVNSTGPELDEDAIAGDIVRHLLDDRSAKPLAAKIDASEYAGTYRGNVLRSKRELTVGTDAQGRVTAAILAWGEEPRALKPIAEDHFTTGWIDYVFVREAGRIVAVQRIGADMHIRFDR